MGPTGLASTAGTQKPLGLATMPPTSTTVAAPVTISLHTGNAVGPASRVQSGDMSDLPVFVSVSNTGASFLPQPAPLPLLE